MLRRIINFLQRFFVSIKSSGNCIVDKSAILYKEAEIINNVGEKNKIIIGKNSHIRGQLLTFGHGGDISIGDYCYVGRNTYIWSGKKIKIGNRVLISHNCNIFDNDTHPLDLIRRHEQFKEIIERGQPRQVDLKDEIVIIEDDVLIGANAVILKGVVLGKGSVIAAGSVVTKNVEPFTVVAGNPAKFIKKIS